MHQHLKKIKNTLRPLFDATVPRIDYFNDVARNVANKTLQDALKNLIRDIVGPLVILNTMVRFIIYCFNFVSSNKNEIL
jgi:hypothetical protein